MSKNTNIYVISTKKSDGNDEDFKPANFEKAIESTGFGKFNLIYLLFAIPSCLATHFESTTLAYILPAAECDLKLSLQDKGTLNAVCYLGMISSAFLWGFLSDTFGRKRLLSITYLLNGFFVLLGGFSQTLSMLLFCKFVSGFISCGPFAILTTTLSEFHCAKYRTTILMYMGSIFGFGNIFLPLVSWNILPLPIAIFLSENIVLHSWNVLLIMCAIPSLISGVAHMCFPESPKFLLTAGRNEEALNVFKKMYSMNTGNPPETYPIKVLIEERHNDDERVKEMADDGNWKKTRLETLKVGFRHLRPLFVPPLLQKIILACIIQFGLMGGLNTLRLWLPQIFQSINDYLHDHVNEEDANLCLMLSSVKTNVTVQEECTVNYDNDSVYINSMIVGATSLVGYFIIGAVINRVGKKNVLIVLGTISGCCSIGLYFAKTSLTVLILSSIIAGFSAICTNTMLTIVVVLFPTTLRTMTVSIVMMIGRCGAMTGNFIFPVLLSLGCLPPFLTIGGVTLLCTFLSLTLPKTDLKALE